MSDEFKPCPFCGGTVLSTGGDDKVVGVQCLRCEARGPNHYGSYEWDNRAGIAALEASDAVWRKSVVDMHDRAMTAVAALEAVKATVSVQKMSLSDGRADYFVSVRLGDRQVHPHVFREEFKAAYHVALYSWLLNGTEKPDLMAFDESDWPAQATETLVPSPALEANQHSGDAPEISLPMIPGGVLREMWRDGTVSSAEYNAELFRRAKETSDMRGKFEANQQVIETLRAALEKEANWLEETAKYLSSVPGLQGSATTHLSRAKSVRAGLTHPTQDEEAGK